MAATSYSTLPSSSYIGHGSQGDSYHSNNYGTYEAGIGSITAHPYEHQKNEYGVNPTDSHQQSLYSTGYQQSTFLKADYHPEQEQFNDHPHPHTSKTNVKSQTKNNNRNNTVTKTTQPQNKNNMNNRQVESKNHQQNAHTEKTQHHPPAPVDNQHYHSQPTNLVRSERQILNPPPKQQKQHKSQPPPQSNLNRTDHQNSKNRASPPLPAHHHSPSNSRNNHALETTPKPNNSSKDLKPNKSSMMRAAAIKKKEEKLEQNRQDKFFPKKIKSQQSSPQTDVEHSDFEKTKLNKKQTRSLPKIPKSSHSDGEQTDTEKSKNQKKKSRSQSKQRLSRRDGYQTDDNNHSSGDEGNHKRHRSKSQKRTTFSDTHLDRHLPLPPVRHPRMPSYYDPYMDYPLPPGHPLRGRFPYHDDYPPYGPYPPRYNRRHLYEDAGDIPPYLAPYHDPYDPFFDYQKRKVQPKKNDPHTDREDNNGHETDRDDGARSQVSRKSKHKNSMNKENGGRKSRHDHEDKRRWPPGYYQHPSYYHHGDDMLEIWRQERNDYLKKKFKPTIHDVLYSQQWMKSDSYLENQRRRALRDAQGYYFPYKKYTLKDYRDMQKLNNQNPFADVNETTIDRKERAKKRQEYGSLIERQMVDNPGTRHVPAREMPPRKPWHLSNGEIPNDPNLASKRERALEYAKVQVKYRPVDQTQNSSHRSDPTEQYVNNLYPETNYDDNEGTREAYQSYDDYD